ncbi:MAG: flagellar basal body-associated FliL family protein [Bdellovibrionaceae bacterium]|nr:flagellar basal body-associated FliL family protein [Pseudobdellovibrionaceae bacterium]
MSEDIKKNNEIDLANEDDVLKSIDSFIAEEDPDFVKNMSELKIDNSVVSLSILDNALEMSENTKAATAFLSVSERLKKMVDFRHNLKLVLKFWFSVVIVIVAVYFATKAPFWDKKTSLFLTSFAEWGTPVQDYNPLNEVQLFFDNPRLSKNILELKKMVVNLKPSTGSSENPMLAFQIRVEGLSKEVMVELKDRESEFVDRVLRVAEDFSYDELVDATGKQKLAEKIIGVMNTNLTKGQVRKVMFSTFFLKN